VIESLKNLFVKQSIDTRIESALPLLAKIQQQGTAMKEANIFEAWAERLVEGTWQTPDTPEKQAKLVELMSTDLPVGADATNVTEQLYDLLGDDELFDQLEALAEQDANADARQVIFDRMQMLSDNPDVLRVIEQLQIDPTAEMNPAEPTNPADLEPVQEGDLEDCDSLGGDASDEFIRGVSVNQQDEAMTEDALRSIRRSAGLLTEEELKENILTDDTGSTLQHIKDTFKRDIKDFETTGEISQHLHDALYDYYQDDMPYGVQKARDGDPYEWVADRFGADLGLPGYGMNSPGVPDEDYGLERESVMHGDYAEEVRDPHSVDGGMENPLIQGEGVVDEAGPEPAVIAHDLLSKLGPIFLPDPTTGQAVDVSKVQPNSSGPVGNQGYKSAPGTSAFKDMGSVVPANPTALPKPAGGNSGGSGADLPKGMLGGPRTPVNEKDDLSLFDDATCNMSEAGESCPVHGVKECYGSDDASPLAGQYGHSGKMKAVDKDLSFLDRLKELSGMKK
jgi:hypothetical protein